MNFLKPIGRCAFATGIAVTTYAFLNPGTDTAAAIGGGLAIALGAVTGWEWDE